MKKLSDIQIDALVYVMMNEISEVVYVKKHIDLFGIVIGEDGKSKFDGDSFYETYQWTHAKVKINKVDFSYKFDWCIDGKTIKALYDRNILTPCRFADGKYGEYTVGYSINNEVFNNYFKEYCRSTYEYKKHIKELRERELNKCC